VLDGHAPTGRTTKKGKQAMAKQYQFRVSALNEDSWPDCMITIEADHEDGATSKANLIIEALNATGAGSDDDLRPPPHYYWAGLQRINNFGN
jgi:hypothetical protein